MYVNIPYFYGLDIFVKRDMYSEKNLTDAFFNQIHNFFLFSNRNPPYDDFIIQPLFENYKKI